MKKFITIFLIIVLCFSVSINTFAVDTDSIAFSNSVEVYNATLDYLNAEYLDTELGTIIEYATPQDIAELTALVEYITANCTTDTEKCDAIYNWMDQNIKYTQSNFTAIDVFRNMSGICSGHAQLFSTLSRLAGIPTAILRGSKVNTNVVTTAYLFGRSNNNYHEWSIAYCDGEWKVYDDLWGFCGETDVNRIATEYFIHHVDGIAPYCSAMGYYSSNNLIETYYKDGSYIGYKNEEQLTNTNVAVLSVGGCLNYTKYYMCPTYKSYYTCNNEVTSIANGYALPGGIYCRLGTNYLYVKHNGILLNNTTFEYNDNTYYTTGAESIILNEDILNNGLTGDCFNMYVGESFDLSEYYPDYKFFVSGNTDGVEIENGIITAVESGYTAVRIAKNGSGTSIKLQIYDGVLNSNTLFMDLCNHEHTHISNDHEYCDYCGYEIIEEEAEESFAEDTIEIVEEVIEESTEIEEELVAESEELTEDYNANANEESIEEPAEEVTEEPTEIEEEPAAESEEQTENHNEESTSSPVEENISENNSSNTTTNDVSYVSSLIKLFVQYSRNVHRIFFMFF